MKITNKNNLPQVLVRALTNDPYTYTGDISVTQMIQSPRQRWLFIRHNDELEEDVMDRIWALLGSAVHNILEQADDKESDDLQEERLEASVGGWTFSGATDLYESDNERLIDFKVTSAWAFLNGIKEEWEFQTNALAYLYEKAGFKVKKLAILCIFRDWSKFKMMASENYPRKQAEVMEVPLWKLEETEQRVLNRIEIHRNAEHLPDDDLPYCTDKECWHRGNTYAVMKNKNKRATRVLDTREEAEDYLTWLFKDEKNLKHKFRIEKRVGEYIKCDNYCSVQSFCSQYKERMELLNDKETAED
jgi:hypothetical protein